MRAIDTRTARRVPSSDELIELDFEMTPPAAIDDDE